MAALTICYLFELRAFRVAASIHERRPMNGIILNDEAAARFAKTPDESVVEKASPYIDDRQRRLHLLEAIADAANSAHSPEHCLQVSLREWCRFTGWPVGHALLVDPLSGSLVSSKLWHLDHPQTYTRFRKISEEYRFPRGVGLPGRVLESGYAHWITDVMKDDNFPRNKSCPTLTLHGAFAFPALINDEVVATLEFFSNSPEAPNPDWLELASQAAPQIGRAFARHRARLALEQRILNARATPR
jgi:GAF domain-containing protein